MMERDARILEANVAGLDVVAPPDTTSLECSAEAFESNAGALWSACIVCAHPQPASQPRRSFSPKQDQASETVTGEAAKINLLG